MAAATSGGLARYSSFGSWLRFAAPECAPITSIGGGTDVGCATSVASPLVAGIVALLRTQTPFASADELEGALARTARPIAGTRHGLINAAAALAALGDRESRLQPMVIGTPVVRWIAGGVHRSLVRCRSRGDVSVGTMQKHMHADRRSDFLPVHTRSLRRALRSPCHDLVVRREPGDLGHHRTRRRGSPASRMTLDHRAATIGAVLRGRPGTWAGTDLRFSTSWFRCLGSCTEIKVGTTYRVRAGDQGYRLRVAVLASNSVGSASARSKPTRVVR